jgi:hypothetical protein
VSDISEMLSNISRKINYCLSSAPMLENGMSLRKSAPNPKAVWYFYMIGVIIIILLAILIAFAAFLLKRKRKRIEALIQIGERMGTIQNATTNQYELTVPHDITINDVWEVSIESLDIDYKHLIGNGAFSVVHSGQKKNS